MLCNIIVLYETLYLPNREMTYAEHDVEYCILYSIIHTIIDVIISVSLHLILYYSTQDNIAYGMIDTNYFSFVISSL